MYIQIACVSVSSSPSSIKSVAETRVVGRPAILMPVVASGNGSPVVVKTGVGDAIAVLPASVVVIGIITGSSVTGLTTHL